MLNAIGKKNWAESFMTTNVAKNAFKPPLLGHKNGMKDQEGNVGGKSLNKRQTPRPPKNKSYLQIQILLLLAATNSG